MSQSQKTDDQEPRLYGSAEGAAMAALPKGTRLRKFQYTSLDQNSNKWYVYEIRDTAAGVHVTGRFGRVGDKGAVKDYGVMYESDLEKLIRERLRKGYVEVELHALKQTSVGGSVALVPASANASADATPEDRLVSLIYKEAGESIKEYLAADVDALSLQQINLGRALIENICQTRSMVPQGRPELMAATIKSAVEAYYKAIPTILPRRIDPLELARSFDTAEQENRLNQLEAAVQTIKAQSSGQTQTQALDGVEIKWLDPNSDAALSLRNWVQSTGGNSSRYGGSVRVIDIYEVLIPAERDRYKQFIDQTYRTVPTAANKKLLFHGSRNGNWRHILKSGLKIMGTAANGRALGNGLYFADQSAKSANYCASVSPGAPLMMLVSEVALGRVQNSSSHYGMNAPAGYDTIFSKGGSSWTFNEYCVFDERRATARFLITFRA